MIKIYGKIESLKKIRTTLKDNGLTEFNSIGEINTFLRNYDSEVRKIREEAELEVTRDHEQLEAEKDKLEEELELLREQVKDGVENEIAELQQCVTDRESKESANTFHRIVNKFMLTVLRYRLRKIENSRQVRINKATANLVLKTENLNTLLYPYTSNKLGIVVQRITPKLEKIEYAIRVLVEINPLIAGAIGESKVEKELMGLSVSGVLVNDFSVNFNPPIYNRKEKDRIYSVQIDHLLVTGAGIFVLETKNWSKKSIQRLDLRSPVAQVKRSSYAVFVLVNSTDDKSLGLKLHHWGKKQIPIRNLIVMIGQKPKEIFKYVKVKTLSGLNGYIEHFESIFSDEEVNSIANYLQSQQQDDTSKNMKKGTYTSNYSSLSIKDGKKNINDIYKDRWS
jgi:hypothetical protein